MVVAGCLSPLAAAMDVYSIGNSLTWDSQPNTIADFADSAGYGHNVGYHIRCNSSLEQIWSDPTGTCVTPTAYGTFGPSLANTTWDAITLQTFGAGGATIVSETQAAINFINLARTNANNAEATFYIYSTWGIRSQVMTKWADPVVDSDSTVISYRRQDAVLLYQRIDAATDANLGFIPAGDVFYALGHIIERGGIAGFSSAEDLFRDSLHASGLGRYAASATVYATLYGNLDGVSSSNLGVATSSLVNQVVLDVLEDFDFAAPQIVIIPEPNSGILLVLICGVVAAMRTRTVRRQTTRSFHPSL